MSALPRVLFTKKVLLTQRWSLVSAIHFPSIPRGNCCPNVLFIMPLHVSVLSSQVQIHKLQTQPECFLQFFTFLKLQIYQTVIEEQGKPICLSTRLTVSHHVPKFALCLPPPTYVRTHTHTCARTHTRAFILVSHLKVICGCRDTPHSSTLVPEHSPV